MYGFFFFQAKSKYPNCKWDKHYKWIQRVWSPLLVLKKKKILRSPSSEPYIFFKDNLIVEMWRPRGPRGYRTFPVIHRQWPTQVKTVFPIVLLFALLLPTHWLKKQRMQETKLRKTAFMAAWFFFPSHRGVCYPFSLGWHRQELSHTPQHNCHCNSVQWWDHLAGTWGSLFRASPRWDWFRGNKLSVSEIFSEFS